MSSTAMNARIFTKIHTGFKGVMQPVMSWLDVNNNNNHPDVFLASDYYVNNKHFVISQLSTSQRNQRFALLHSPFPALYHGDAAAADYDRDGDEDIVMTGLNKFNHPVMQLYRNDGHGYFTLIPQSFTPLSDGSVEWGKVDRGHRTSNAFVTRKEAEASRMQMIESYKAKGFEVHFFDW